MQQDHTSTPQIVDLDPADRDGHTLSTSVLLTAQSVANLPLNTFPSPFTNAPLLAQKCASNRAQPPSPTFNLIPITDLSTASTASSSSTPQLLHASSHRVPDSNSTTDSLYKGLRPKASYHQSLLNLRDELFRPSDSGAFPLPSPPRVPVEIRILIIIAVLGASFHQPVSHGRLIWRLLQNLTRPV